MGINIDKAAGDVIGAASGAYIKGMFKLDTRTFDWTKDYLKDKALRTEIDELRNEIAEITNSPIFKAELQKMFEDRIEHINHTRIMQLVEHLKGVQAEQAPLLNEMMLSGFKIGGASFNPCLIHLTPENIEEVFSQLQEGVPHKEKERKIKERQNKIVDLEKIITDELSPRERWFHRADGLPEPFPGGCRWHSYVSVWEKVASKFTGPVGVEGEASKSDNEMQAYYRLGLDKIGKRAPLRDPIELA